MNVAASALAASGPSSSPLPYRPDIDGLRAAAVLLVVGFHAFPQQAAGGFVGVDVFFVISGYLISCILLRALEKDAFSFLDFYGRRVRRIFPALALVLFATFAAGWLVLLADEYRQLGMHMAGGAAFLSNFVLWSESGYFDNASHGKPLLHLWSLGIEEQFYLCWPVLLWVAWKRGWNLRAVTALLAGLSLAFNLWVHLREPVTAFYGPHARAWELLAGALLAIATFGRSARAGDSATAPRLAVADAMSVLGMGLLAATVMLVTQESAFPGYWALMPVLGTALVIAAGHRAWINRTILSARPLVWVGLISFPLYLWHWPLLSFAYIVEAGPPDAATRTAAVVASFVLAWMTYRWIEHPLRHGGRMRAKALGSVCVVAVAGLVGYTTHARNGLDFRPIAVLGAELTAAKSDWSYTSTEMSAGEITGLNVLPGSGEGSVLYVGDSLMGQYYPRAVEIHGAAHKPRFSSVFASRNHCRPLPNHDFMSGPVNCRDYYRAALALAAQPQYVRVVFAGSWPPLSRDGRLTAEANLFVRDLKRLREMGKEVFVLSNPPMHAQFDPSAIAAVFRRNSTTELTDRAMPRSKLENLEWLRAVNLIGAEAGATIINPFDYLCREGRCPYVLAGKPLYTDHVHLRAAWARAAATFVDDLAEGRSPAPRRGFWMAADAPNAGSTLPAAFRR